MLGPVDDAFFRWVTDLGVTGPDQGRGGRYLFVGPNYDGELPTQGFHIVRSDTYVNWLLMRAFVTDTGTEGAVAGVKAAMKVYPLSEAASPPEQAFVNISGKQMNTIHANDVSFFTELNAVVHTSRPMRFQRSSWACSLQSGSRRAKSSNRTSVCARSFPRLSQSATRRQERSRIARVAKRPISTKTGNGIRRLPGAAIAS